MEPLSAKWGLLDDTKKVKYSNGHKFSSHLNFTLTLCPFLYLSLFDSVTNVTYMASDIVLFTCFNALNSCTLHSSSSAACQLLNIVR